LSDGGIVELGGAYLKFDREYHGACQDDSVDSAAQTWNSEFQ